MIDQLDGTWVAQLGRAERHIRRVARHITQGARAKIEPATPVEGMINALLERPRLGRTQPDIPLEPFRNRVAPRWTRDALRPDRSVAPDVNLLHVADQPGMHDFYRAAQAVLGAALVAHLRDHPVFLGNFAQVTRFINGLSQRLLAVNMFSELDRGGGHERMAMVGR